MSRLPSSPSALSSLGVWAFALLLLSCGPKDSGIGKHRADHGAGPGALPAEFRGQVPALSDAQVLGFLPDTTMAALFVRSPRELDQSTEFSAILREYKEVYEFVRPHLTIKSGASLLSPETWSLAGVDPQRPAGAAVLMEDSPIAVLFATLADKELFRRSLDQIGTEMELGSLVAASAGESTIYVFQELDEIALVVRGDVVMVVIPASRRDLNEIVLAVAGASSAPTLASSARVAKVFAGFDHGKDVAGFVSFDRIARMFMRFAGDFGGRSPSEIADQENESLRESIADAKAHKGSKQDIALLEAELLSSMRRQRETRERRDAGDRLLDGLLGAIGTVAFGVELDGSDARMRFQLSPSSGSLAATILGPSPRPLALATRLREAPLFLLGAHLDAKVATKLFYLFMAADGDSPESWRTRFAKEVGIPFHEILESFDGELSGAFTADPSTLSEPAYEGHESKDMIGMHILAHLRDPSAARSLFDRLCANAEIAPFVIQHQGAKALLVPSFNDRKLRIEIDGDYLQAMSVGPGKAIAKWTDSEKRILHRPHSVANMIIDPVLVTLYLSEESHHYAFDVQYGENSATTARAKPIRDELATLYRKRTKLEDARYEENRARVGRIVVSAQPHAGGFALLAELRGQSKNLGRSAQRLIELASPSAKQARVGTNAALLAIEQKIEKLEQSLWTALEGP